MDTKLWYQSKTNWFNLISLVLAVLALPQFISILPVNALPVIAFINALGNLILRNYFTTTAIE